MTLGLLLKILSEVRGAFWLSPRRPVFFTEQPDMLGRIAGFGQKRTSKHTPIVERLPMTDARLFMEYFVAHRAANLPVEALAEVFDRLIWCFADNGHAICAARDEWLQSADEYKVDIALTMNEVFPFSTKVQMEEHLHRIALQFPRLREKCAKWLERAKALP